MIDKMDFKLGGWHRLWIVLSILYLIPVIAFSYDAFPKKFSDMDFYRLEQPIHYNNAHSSERTHSLEARASFLLTAASLDKESSNKELKTQIDEEIRGQFLMALKQQRMSAILNGFLAWIAPVIALYLFSWSVGWIFRGFKNAKA